jgi:hypothetical protein
MTNETIWNDKDLLKVGSFAAVIGCAIGFVLGYEAAWTPAIINCFRPLIG